MTYNVNCNDDKNSALLASINELKQGYEILRHAQQGQGKLSSEVFLKLDFRVNHGSFSKPLTFTLCYLTTRIPLHSRNHSMQPWVCDKSHFRWQSVRRVAETKPMHHAVRRPTCAFSLDIIMYTYITQKHDDS